MQRGQRAVEPRVPTSAEQLRTLLSRELLQVRRDRAGLAFSVLGAVLAALLAAVAFSGSRPVKTTIAVVVAPEIQDETAARLDGFGAGDLRARVVTDEREARGLFRSGEVAAIVRVETGGTATNVRVVANRSERIAEAVAVDLARAVLVTGEGGALPPSEDGRPVREATVWQPLNSAELYGPPLAVFFLFLSTGVVARSLHAERAAGTLSRLRAVDVSALAILASKGCALFLLGMVQLAAVFGVLRIVMGADWGSLVGVLLIAVSVTLAVGAIALLVTTLTRTLDQAFAAELIVALMFGVLGGRLIPVPRLPVVVRRLSDFTPNGVAITSFRRLAAGATVPEVLPSVLVILGFAVVIGLLALVRARKVIEW